MLRHELDWIVMKALAKDRGGRYQSAGELASDIGRYLKDEPVEARPPRLRQMGPSPSNDDVVGRRTLGPAVCLVIAAAGLLIGHGGLSGTIQLAVSQQRQAKDSHDLADVQQAGGHGPRNQPPRAPRRTDLSQAWNVGVRRGQEGRGASSPARCPGFGTDRTAGASPGIISGRSAASSYEELHGHDGNVYGVAFSPDGKIAGNSCGEDKTIVLWDLATRKPRLTDSRGTPTTSMSSCSPATAKAVQRRRRPHGADLERGGRPADAALDEFRFGVCQVILHPDGKTLIATDTDSDGDKNGETSIFDIDTGGKLEDLKGQRTLAVSPTAGFIATASPDLAIRLLDVQDARAWPKRGATVRSFDGRLLTRRPAAGDGIPPVKAQALGDPGLKPVAELVGHHSQIRGTAFSADGQTLASVGNDGQELLWDVAGRKLLALIIGCRHCRLGSHLLTGWQDARVSNQGEYRPPQARDPAHRPDLTRRTSSRSSKCGDPSGGQVVRHGVWRFEVPDLGH